MLPIQQHPAFDLILAWTLLRRAPRTRSFILLLVIGIGVTGVFAFRARPVYRSETALLYKDRSVENPVAPQRAEIMSPRRIGLAIQEMLFTRTLLEKLIKDFGLYEETVARFGLVTAVEEMQKRDLHFSAREGYTFRLSYDNASPEVAQKVVARASDYLIQAHIDKRVDDVKEIERFLDGEKRRVEKDLHDRESELALFLAKNPSVLEFGAGRSGVEIDASGAETASLGLEMQALQLRERLSQLRQQASSTPQLARSSVPREVSETRLRVEAELMAAQRELADKQAQFTKEYPDVKRAIVRVESAKARLRHLDESAVAASSLSPSPSPTVAADSGEARLLQQQIELLEKQKRVVRSQGRRTPSRARTTDPNRLGHLRAQYVELERRTRESRERLSLLEDRKFQAEMQALFATQNRSADLVVADPAFKPTVPLRSPRKKIIVIGGAATLFMAFVVGILMAIKDDRLRQSADLKRFDLPPLLCEIPPP